MNGYTFYDEQHVKSYLSGSIIRVNGRAARIGKNVFTKDGGDIYVEYWNLTTDASLEQVKLYSPAVDLNPVPLGMCNYGPSKSVVYIVRYPARVWKVGLYEGNISYYGFREYLHRLSIGTLINSPYLANTIEGIYPSLEELSVLFRKGYSLVAVSRHIAFNRVGDVFCFPMQTPVGKINFKTNHITLGEKFLFLLQSMALDRRFTCS